MDLDMEVAVKELAPQLFRYSLGRTRDAGLAEEVSQDALAALVQRWRRHGPPECPAAFAFAVARRRAGRLNFQRRLLEPLHALLDGNGRSPHSTSPGPEEIATLRTDLGRTLTAMRKLPGRDREALLLVGAGELGPTEGARVLGISVSALKMRLHRARKRLLQILEEKQDGKP
jgi:RNA polymerase sigma-70 factor (ECF subfamily)